MATISVRVSNLWKKIGTPVDKPYLRWQLRDILFTLFTAVIFSLLVTNTCHPLEMAFEEFFLKNEKILDIYWNTILIVLTLLLPFSIEIIQSLKQKYNGFGPELYFLSRGIKIYKLFWLLPVLCFSLLFLVNSNTDSVLDKKVMTFIHAFVFYLWATFFWYILGILYKSISIMLNNNESMNEMFLDRLNDSSDSEAEEKWKAVWDTIDSLTEKWRRTFLKLFWTRQNKLIDSGAYDKSTFLFEDFSTQFLAIKDSGISEITLHNFRKKFLWFHEKNFNDKEENPYSVFIRLLDIYRVVFSKKETLEDPGAYRLFDTLRNILEQIITKELQKTDDFYFGFFRQLRAHIKENIEDRGYLHVLPIYRIIFDNANHYDLYSYEPRTDDGFPNGWKISIENIDQLFSRSPDDIMREIWYEKFFDWARDRVKFGAKEFDSTLDSTLDLLFPELYKPWLALGLAYHMLPWSGNRIISLCNWERNFGSGSVMGDSYWYDPTKTDRENEIEMANQIQNRIQTMRENSAKVIKKLGLFGPLEKVREINRDLKAFESSTPNINAIRQDLILLTDAIIALTSSQNNSNFVP